LDVVFTLPAMHHTRPNYTQTLLPFDGSVHNSILTRRKHWQYSSQHNVQTSCLTLTQSTHVKHNKQPSAMSLANYNICIISDDHVHYGIMLPYLRRMHFGDVPRHNTITGLRRRW